MGLWPTQGDEKRLLEAQSLPLVIPERSEVEGPVVFAKQPLATLSVQLANFPGSNRPPLVIPTEAKRSGGICSLPCGLIDLRLGMTNDRVGLL
jgi:hypothetical protein